MNNWRLIRLATLTLLLAFSSLRAEAPAEKRFKDARPGYAYTFPRDHGSHSEFQIEWWYFTGNLESKGGTEYGYELTFFRRGIANPKVLENPSRWAVREIYLAHFAVTDPSGRRFHYQEKISREAIGKAGAKEDRLEVWIDHWQAVQEGDQMKLRAGGIFKNSEDWRIDLVLTPSKPLVIHGKSGISRKGEEEGQASHYYSFTRLDTTGLLWIDGKEEPVTGSSWMDHEFSTSILNPAQIGWDWFSIQLDDQSEVMIYQIRRKGGEKDPVSSGTIISPDGTVRHLKSDEFLLTSIQNWKSKNSGAVYPVSWRIEIPSEQLVLTSKPFLQEQELMTAASTRVTYWEGASHFKGTKAGKTISGKGYIELTGYAEPFTDSLPE
jgi:predicted secreted hydrolase